MEQRQFGLGERVKYAYDWPKLPNPAYTIPAGTLGTVVMVPEGRSPLYMVRLDEAIPGFIPEMNCLESALEPA